MKKNYFDLFYIYKNNLGYHTFQIGYFSCKNKVLNAIEKLKDKPGFINNPEGFHFRKIAITFPDDVQTSDISNLYELSFEKSNADGTDTFEIIGIYSTHNNALERKTKMIGKKRFSQYANNFCIAEIKLDCIGWVEGFSPW